MRTLGLVEPQMLIVAAFSRHEAALDWGRAKLREVFGPICVEGPTIDFVQTRYYEKSMGGGLRKQFLAFERLVEQDQLAAVKRRTIELEEELMRGREYEEERPINLDPGFLSLGKFVLATTKDQAHRIYLHGGIFAEVTLRFHEGEFEARPWTYADWKLPEVFAFLKEARVEYGRLRVQALPRAAGMPRLLVPERDERANGS
jgi:hypothetical protein